MPEIPVGAQIFDFVFHPTHSSVYTGLLSGEVKAFGYDDQGQHESKFVLRPSKRSCRGLAIGGDGAKLWAVGKGKGLHTIDTTTSKVVETRAGAHEAPINRVRYLLPWMLSTGDDDGVVKLWDPRKSEAIRSYHHHFDYITDFLWLEDKKQLVATSGDSTLSVIDVRSKKTEPFAQSEDQEDELLSIVPIKGHTKVVVGTQLGMLSIFNRNRGWGDCVDRVPGHPHSVDALCALPSSYPSSNSTILTGSSDGLLRAVQLLPTKLVGIVADHGSFPIERIVVDHGGEGRWVGSAGHEDVLRMTDLRDVFEDEGKNSENQGSEDGAEVGDRGNVGLWGDAESDTATRLEGMDEVDAEDEDEALDEPKEKKRKRKNREKDPLVGKKRKGRNEIDAEPSFFSEL